MALTYEELKQIAQQIRDNELPESNTASLVGGLFDSIVEKMLWDREYSDREIKSIKELIVTETDARIKALAEETAARTSADSSLNSLVVSASNAANSANTVANSALAKANAAVPLSQKGVADGVAPLDEDNKIPVEHLPDIDLGLVLGFSVGQAFPGEVGKELQSAVEEQQSKLDLLYDRKFPITASLRVDDITSEAETISNNKAYPRDAVFALLGIYSSLKQAGSDIAEGEITDIVITQQNDKMVTIREEEFLDIADGKSFESWENVGVPAGANAQGALKTTVTFNMSDGKSYKATHTLYFACPVFFAVVPKDFEVTQAGIEALVADSATKKSTQATKTYKATFSQESQKNCYIVPQDYGALSSITDGQDNYIGSYDRIDDISLKAADGSTHKYYAYIMKEASSVSDFTLTFQ